MNFGNGIGRMLLVVIESPFAGDTERNMAYLAACMRDSILRGEAPYASHGLYTLPGCLDDDVPEERTLGINAGLAWGDVADLRAVYTNLGISRGMQLGIDRAASRAQRIEQRSLTEEQWPTIVEPPRRSVMVAPVEPSSGFLCLGCGQDVAKSERLLAVLINAGHTVYSHERCLDRTKAWAALSPEARYALTAHGALPAKAK